MVSTFMELSDLVGVFSLGENGRVRERVEITQSNSVL